MNDPTSSAVGVTKVGGRGLLLAAAAEASKEESDAVAVWVDLPLKMSHTPMMDRVSCR